MNETYSLAPVWFTDVVGSALMVVFSILSVVYAVRLVKAQPSSVIWTYVLWLSVALAVFSVSRSVGHIAKRFLLAMDLSHIWVSLRPLSGGLNTITFIVVASITLFFQRVQKINVAILNDKKALEEAGQEVMRLNRDLELLVRHRTEELSRSERKYRRVFEGSMDVIFILNSDTRFVDINTAGVSTFGFGAKEEMIGQLALGQLFALPHEFDEVMCDLRSQGYVKDRECRMKSANGAELSLLLSATVRRDESGRIVSYEGIAKDITARRQMERQLQMADKLASLGQVSTGIAHEVNNPLGIILGYTQLLLRETGEGTQIYDDLKTIEKHGRHCKTIVEDLLKFARSTQTHKTSINVNETLDQVISLLGHQFELDNVALIRESDANIPSLVADEEKLKQVFMNLLMNARQSISGTGRITVRTAHDASAGEVMIEITDTGCGISPDIIGKIFDPFFTTKPVGEGTGLGLSVSYGIVQDHNGRIEVSSCPGEGSTFAVHLPIGDSQP
ncbi:MAG: PAS domain S-box protein [Desulfomonile sp.]|nr:PAS domain S-box protein [Desulfomonile sp.]